jgi:hypothetical protein
MDDQTGDLPFSLKSKEGMSLEFTPTNFGTQLRYNLFEEDVKCVLRCNVSHPHKLMLVVLVYK